MIGFESLQVHEHTVGPKGWCPWRGHRSPTTLLSLICPLYHFHFGRFWGLSLITLENVSKMFSWVLWTWGGWTSYIVAGSEVWVTHKSWLESGTEAVLEWAPYLVRSDANSRQRLPELIWIVEHIGLRTLNKWCWGKKKCIYCQEPEKKIKHLIWC